jgi:hypothetical protein
MSRKWNKAQSALSIGGLYSNAISDAVEIAVMKRYLIHAPQME